MIVESAQLPHKLVAILFADVAGYSRLIGADEDGTHLVVRAYLDLFAKCIRRHRGKVDNYAGDSVLADFGSATDAVTCALEVQKRIKDRNAEVPSSKRVEFRIGVNLGEVIVDRGEIHGDRVNVAARLQSLVEPGCVCVSDSVRKEVIGKLQLKFEPIGARHVKNIKHPIKAFKVEYLSDVALSEEAPEDVVASQMGTKHKASILVLPFDSLSGDDSQRYFCDGLANDIATELSRFWSIIVVSSLELSHFANEDLISKSGRGELSVRYILKGSVRIIGERVRINAQLVERETGHQVWAEKFDRKIDDLISMQDEIIQSIVVSLALNVGTLEEERAMKRKRVDSDAYDAFLKGFHCLANTFGKRGNTVKSARCPKLAQTRHGVGPGFLSTLGSSGIYLRMGLAALVVRTGTAEFGFRVPQSRPRLRPNEL